ncbi:MAG: tyrosine-type recombinase/integrase [Beijerinckiaceae bacterium]
MIFNALNPMKAKSLGPGKFADGQGLWLIKRSRQAGKWILRLTVDGKRREMGLGPWPDVALAQAREMAVLARREARSGVDPIQARHVAKRRRTRLTVADAIQACFEARQAQLKADGKAGRWLSPLSTHVIPAIGKTPIEDVDQHVLKRVLEPIWHEKADIARKATNRINLTLKHAAALGLEVDLQAVMKVRALLGKQRHETSHIPSMPYQEAPAYYQSLCRESAMSALALRFLMLTVARTGEIRFARHTDNQDGILVVPPSISKTGIEHRIPLVDEALRVIAAAKSMPNQELLFPSPTERPMSDATLARHMERAGLTYRPHGFRATFRTWAEEQTDAEYEVKETILGHKVGSQVERAYQRSDLLQKRCSLLRRWENFLTLNA